ncbi:DUF1467 family protein [Devosia algicola]|uniref:DUF1467 family protein n=1 Tax=Devosia algicola TaxID=3026418 RepID=A0ABY7YPH3_9HYPH|nr:DUF1467 family protein [Devosia algicola]WDR03213.1 DUF1467 family protein [Devosia algicola]
MPIASIIAIYFIVWWLCLFVVLPIGVRSQLEDGNVIPGTEPGAPTAARLLPKIGITSILAVVVTLALFWALTNPWLQAYWR